MLDEALAHPRARDVAALGLTNQRETVFALERGTGRALGRGIVWQDRRTEPRCAELRAAGHDALVRARAGIVGALKGQKDPALIGIPDAEWGQRVKAFVLQRT